jgi:amino acid adenylation domain-containing protein
VLIAAFNVLLYRYTGQEDIIIGTSVANRNKREFQGVMGLFINTLPIRTRVDGTFREYLRHVQSVCMESLAHQEFPFEKLIGELNPQRNLNAHPLFQVMFVYQNVPAQYEVPGSRTELFKVDYQISKFDLNLWIDEKNEELLLTLYYYRDLFNATTIKRFLTHYQTILESIVSDPDCLIKHLAYFQSEEREFILSRFGVSENALPTDVCFHRRFEKQVEKCPDSIAVECLGEKLTYRQLNSKANLLAHHLLSKLKTGVECPVGLLMGRNPQMIMGLMGILKSGNAYLPLDAAYPVERIEMIVKDSKTEFVVTEERFRTTVESLSIKAIYLDSDWEDIARKSDENPDIEMLNDQLVYVMYTSGTTGTPKGVCVEHKNLVNYCDAIWNEMKLSADDRFATVSSLAADLGNTMIFPPLANGGCVVVIPDDLITDASGLSAYFERYPVDCLKIVPSHLHALLKSEQPLHILPAKLLIVGGEICSIDLIKTIRNIKPQCRILNHYGPTESTIGVLTYEVTELGERELKCGTLPIGFPLAGSRVYVLDKEQQPVPVGISGEIYIGGANVTRGYLNRPELNAERFVSNPFIAGDKLYRTGDKGKILEEGTIAFIGRIDRQIKIRGFRVELPEIENVLSKHSGVEQAVVLPPVEDDPRQQLVAYIQAKQNSRIDAEIIKQYLRNRLPSYMIPGAFVFPKTIPLTSNGKIDYRALSGYESRQPEKSHQSPRDQIELELTLIWQNLLGIDGVGIGENFFEIGGHSLLAVQLISQINEKFGQHLPLASLFEYGTIKQIAKVIREKKVVKQSSPLVSIQPKGSGTRMFFVHPAGGNVLCYYELAQSIGTGFPFYGLQAMSSSNGDDHSVSITNMARLYLDAVLEIPKDQPQVFGGWSMGALVAFEMACLYAQEYEQPPIVAVLDQIAPEANTNDLDKNDDLSRLLSFSKKVSQLIGKDLGVTHDLLAGQTPEEHSAVFLDKFKANNLVPENTSLKDFHGFLELMITHNRVTAEYSPNVYHGKIVVFRAEEVIALNSELYEAMGISKEREPDLGWQKYSSQPVEIIPVPGNHVSMITNPNVQVLAEKIARQISNAH